jgi:2',3'-cyclic-nucleotide 2'-phosphodiesterase/3'-nucleotidase
MNDSNDDETGIELSRRQALAALSSIGAASAGAGLATSAYFSDQETFENNALMAGELDVKAAYAAYYSDWRPNADGVAEDAGVDEVVMYDGAPGTVGDAGDLPDGLTGLPADDAWLIAVSDPDRFLDNTRTGAAGTASCPGGTDAADLDQPVIDVPDLKPGDFGEVTIDFTLCDNPGFVTLDGAIVESTENGTTEPEGDDPDERDPGVELLDVVQAAVWVDDGNNYQDGEEMPVVVDSLRNVLGLAEDGAGVALNGDLPATQGGGAGDLGCFSADTTHSVSFAWFVPTDHGNEIQGDSLTFSVGLYTEQCRHNDGTTLTILHDTHVGGRLGPADSTENIENYFGLVDALSDPGRTLRLGVGDDLGSSALSTEFQGSHVIDPFEAGDLAYDTFGNHEFDFGPEVLRERVAETEGFRWVSANANEPTGEVFAAEEGATRFELTTVAGVPVGITGILTPRAREVTSLGDATVTDPIAALNDVVPRMRDAGAEVVIVLSHVSNDRVRGVDNFEGRGIAANVDGIDLIVGDDSAETFDEAVVIDGTICSFVGDEYDFLGEVTLDVGNSVEGFDRTVYDVSETVPERGVTASEPVREAANFYREGIDATVIGESLVPLDTRGSELRTRETNIGNFVADAIRDDVGADIAIQNGGGIRTGTLYSPGDITDFLIDQILPFPNITVELEVSGETIHDALENGVSEFESLEGRFPQVSGVEFAWNPNGPSDVRDPPADGRVDPTDVLIGGQPLDLDATYTVGTNDFMANGGDGYDMFTSAPRTGDGGTNLAELVKDRIRTRGTISPEVEGRITRLSGGTTTSLPAVHGR